MRLRRAGASLFPMLFFISMARGQAPGGDPHAPDGTIVRVEPGKVYFDLPAARGLREGQTIRVLRTIAARHPVTGAELLDHFPLGTITVEGVGAVLSFGRADKRIAALVKVGDAVQLETPIIAKPERVSEAAGDQKSEAKAQTQARVETEEDPGEEVPPTAQSDTPASEIGRVFQSTLGRPLEERIQILHSFLKARPDTPYRALVGREISSLSVIAQTLSVAKSRSEEAGARAEAEQKALAMEPVFGGTLPAQLYDGDPLEIAIYAANPTEVTAAFAYVRPSGQLRFQRLPMAPDGDGYFRARAPRELVTAPSVEVFVEVFGKEITAHHCFGDSRLPTTIPVYLLPVGPKNPGPGHSAVRGFFEFVDFNRFKGNDYYLLTESDFMYRLGGVLYSVRTGFGVLYGRGGSVNDLDRSNDPELQKGHEVGFNYAYVEAQLRFHRLVALSGRMLGGQTVQGDGLGGELRLRIGNELGTNLVLGGSLATDIGALALLQLEWDVVQNFPMSASVIVTNQPAKEDIGVRLVYQIAYRARPWIQPALRIGYDVRNIQHGGLSIGLGLVMSW